MNDRQTDLAVIGAGSAGLAAFREALRHTDNAVLIDPGPLGTTCARTGCMPSKALIHVAETFYRRRFLDEQGIVGGGMLVCSISSVLQHVRRLRDRFVEGMQKTTRELAGDRLICARAELIDKHRILAGSQTIRAERIILAVGAAPVVPDEWKRWGDRVLTSETIFEQKTLPHRIAVIGLGPVGLELGLALRRLGLDISGFSADDLVGGLSDPQVNAEMVRIMENEFPLFRGARAEVSELDSGELMVSAGGRQVLADAVLAAVGVSPNLKNMGLEKLGLNPEKMSCDPATGQVGDLPIYVVGDANGKRPVLHEALDEGTLAAAHALQADAGSCGCRRVPLWVVFSDPEIAVVGMSYSELPADAVIGVAELTDQSRAVIENRNYGRMHLYVERKSGQVLGAEICAPDAVYFGHLLALAVQQRCTVFDLLQMPFYHPTLMEALRTAARHAADPCDPDRKKAAAVLDWCCTEKPLS